MLVCLLSWFSEREKWKFSFLTDSAALLISMRIWKKFPPCNNFCIVFHNILGVENKSLIYRNDWKASEGGNSHLCAQASAPRELIIIFSQRQTYFSSCLHMATKFTIHSPTSSVTRLCALENFHTANNQLLTIVVSVRGVLDSISGAILLPLFN